MSPGEHFRALRRSVVFLLFNLAMFAIYGVAILLGPDWRHAARRLWCRGPLRIAGMEVRRHGAPATGRPVLFLVNHVSYFDIVVLGSGLDAVFVAKSEVARWPFFGWIGRMADTVFIPRRLHDAPNQTPILAERLARGESLILFPEGTNTHGHEVRPFRSSLLKVAEPGVLEQPIYVQPVSLAFTRSRDGAPLSGVRRSLYAWVEIEDLFRHLWRALGQKGAVAEVMFHAAVPSEEVASRKALARWAEREVARGVAELWKPLGVTIEQSRTTATPASRQN